jgi:hypothetical protein
VRLQPHIAHTTSTTIQILGKLWGRNRRLIWIINVVLTLPESLSRSMELRRIRLDRIQLHFGIALRTRTKLQNPIALILGKVFFFCSKFTLTFTKCGPFTRDKVVQNHSVYPNSYIASTYAARMKCQASAPDAWTQLFKQVVRHYYIAARLFTGDKVVQNHSVYPNSYIASTYAARMKCQASAPDAWTQLFKQAVRHYYIAARLFTGDKVVQNHSVYPNSYIASTYAARMKCQASVPDAWT